MTQPARQRPRVVIAVDKFRGSLESFEVAAALAAGMRRSAADPEITVVPMADGGEGTLAAAVSAGFTERFTWVDGPLAEPVRAGFGIRTASHTGVCEAIIELAQASGLDLIAEHDRDVRAASSYGVGQLVGAALDAGAQRIFLALGGSACSDAGAGMLGALGVRLRDADGRELARGGAALSALEHVDLLSFDSRLVDCEVIIATDVDNVLCGAEGAAAIFARQKGASAADIRDLDDGARRLSECLASAAPARSSHIRLAAVSPGAGAGGGVGFAALTLPNSRRMAGVDLVCELGNLDDKLRSAELIVTGEGSLDRQSLRGKTPIGVAQAAARAGVRAIAVCGVSDLTATEVHEAGFASLLRIRDRARDSEQSMSRAAEFLEDMGTEIADSLR